MAIEGLTFRLSKYVLRFLGQSGQTVAPPNSARGGKHTLEATRSLSVIVTAYNRREFVSEAIRSVASQDIDLSNVELIVATNLAEFGTPTLVREVARNNEMRIRTIYPGPAPLGQSQASAISASSGRIITFLNDDDLWEKNRLRIVSERFAQDPNLGFLHNGQSFIGPDGSPSDLGLSYSIFKHPSGLFKHAEAYLSPAEAARRPWILRRYEADFNTSSIAFRREIIESRLDDLAGIFAMDDSFYLYSALASGMMILLTSAPLTKYRLHNRNESFHSHHSKTAVAERASSLSSRYAVQLRAFRALVESQSWPNVTPALDLDQLYIAMVHEIQDSKSSRVAVGRILLAMLSRPIDAISWKWVVAEAAAIGHLMAPGIVRSIYSRL